MKSFRIIPCALGILLAAFPCPLACAWESDKAGEALYSYFPASDLKDEEGKVQMQSVRAYAGAPLSLGESLFLSLRAAYQGLFASYEDLVFTYTNDTGQTFTEADLPTKLHAVDVALGFGAVLSDGLTLYAEFQPGVHSDFKYVSKKDIYYQGGVMLSYDFSEEFSALLGAYYGDDFGRPQIFPLIGVEWQIDDNLALDVFLPEYAVVSYLAADWLTIGLHARLEGQQFRLSDGAPWENTVACYKQVLAGPYFDIHFGKHVTLRLEGGIATMRTFEFKDDDSSAKLYDGDLKDGAYASGSFAFYF